MKKKSFLHWVADRLVYVHREPENCDFVLQLRRLADEQADEHTDRVMPVMGRSDIGEDDE